MLAIIVALIPASLGLLIAIGLGLAAKGDKAEARKGLVASVGLILLALIVARYA